MKIKRFFKLTFKLIVAALLWLMVFIAEWGFYFVGIFFTFTENWLAAIMSLLFALVMEIKKVANKKVKRPKDLIDKIKRARISARNNQYPYRTSANYQRDMHQERAAYEHGFDAGCDFILNLEDK